METDVRKRSRRDFIDPAALMRIKSLELRARTVVEGFQSGLNRSPYYGFSVEFTEYRQYVSGDDLRYLDWKLFARSDRYYIKRFEDETNLRCHLLLDLSRSMGFGSTGYTKGDYARTLVATVAWFLAMQRDAVGLVTFDEKIQSFVPARYRARHIRRLLVTLERQLGGTSTNLAAPLERVAERVRKRGMLILVSDLLAPIEAVQSRLGYLRARGHEVLVFQVLDPAELDLDFDRPALFRDLESGREIYVDPDAARQQYRRRLGEHIDGIRRACLGLGVSFRQIVTDTPLEIALVEFLRSRQARTAGTDRTERPLSGRGRDGERERRGESRYFRDSPWRAEAETVAPTETEAFRSAAAPVMRPGDDTAMPRRAV